MKKHMSHPHGTYIHRHGVYMFACMHTHINAIHKWPPLPKKIIFTVCRAHHCIPELTYILGSYNFTLHFNVSDWNILNTNICSLTS